MERAAVDPREEALRRLPQLKESLNIDFEEKDGELLRLLEVSADYCSRVSNRSEESLIEEGGGSYPPAYDQAVLLLARHWFETGGTMTPASMKENPMGFQMLINQFYLPLSQ